VAARASLLKMTPRKWRLVRTFETLLRAILPVLPPPRALEAAQVQPKSILVVEYWNLGDLAMLVPFLRSLRRRFPCAKISLLVNEGLKSFLEGQGLVDEFIAVRVPWAQHFSRWRKYNPFSRHWQSLIRVIWTLRERQFNWVISGRMDLRDNLLTWLTGAPRRIGYGVGGGGFLLTDRVPPDISRPLRADIWLHLLEVVDKPMDQGMPEFRLTSDEQAAGRAFFEASAIPEDAFVIGIHPGARIATRRWGDERFAEVARRLLSETDAHIVWFAEPGSMSNTPRLERCHLASLDFRTFLAVLSRCNLLACNDSGPMHLAGLLGVPVVAVFGPGKPEWYGPRGAKDRIVIRPEFWCRPCFDYCIFDEPYCLRLITVGEVYSEIVAALEDLRATLSEKRTSLWKIKPVDEVLSTLGNRGGLVKIGSPLGCDFPAMAPSSSEQSISRIWGKEK